MISSRRLSGKAALVTGSSRGIGRAIALALAQEGADVAVNFRVSREAAEKVTGEIAAFGQRAMLVQADVSVRSEVEGMADKVVSEFGRIDVLVNNAGVGKHAPAEELSEEDWDLNINTDLKGVFLCSQAAGRMMIKQGKGSIINIASFTGLLSVPRETAYCCAKAGVMAMTRSLAIEWGKHNVRVNCIAPGFIMTEMAIENIKKGLRSQADVERMIQRTPLKRYGMPEDIGGVAVLLASDESSFMTGQTLIVDGGWSVYGYI